MHGWIILDKPLGLGSTQAVSAVKRALRQGGYGKVKVGHGGTLDPLATGVLPVALGEATKLAGRMLDASKIYDFTIGFGTQTDTLDAEGQVVATSDVRPTRADIDAVLQLFTGPISQMPPAFSALKVDGKRAYDLARAGEDVVLQPRDVTIHALEIASSPVRGGGPAEPVEGLARTSRQPFHHPLGGPPPRTGEELAEITLTAHVSKGTYIRSLARDIALALETVGHVTMLRRTKAGPFTLTQAISLDKLAEHSMHRALEDITLPLTAGLDDIPALPVTPDQARLLRQGQVLIGIAAHQGLHLATEAETPVALVEVSGPEIRVVRGFNL
ncbi:tRNA pseudouridine(55) synthase TruB [Sphingomonas sp. LaA6.9]|uniref:tRNA pseudouridine(55) synthase TruB n=1 Tax=Sphingomonas sp. LaA6.9 TaxID=2919914 RepID=UPI001F5025F5|nr:tRNA pseudouridine(55) synthase TruB [Sphingomonas sp. LaA6.9]MCJ8157981.1 tRNA pseudouridine(55) synthase TruB [Sphingomonas sp. LaA6.9]